MEHKSASETVSNGNAFNVTILRQVKIEQILNYTPLDFPKLYHFVYLSTKVVFSSFPLEKNKQILNSVPLETP